MMLTSSTIALMGQIVSALLLPVIIVLLVLLAIAIWETGRAFGERFGGVQRLSRAGDAQRLSDQACRGIDRADLLSRVGPMLGLMGTLIPLGPGLAALGRGDLAVLAEAVTVAFNTTVLGLLIGIVGFVIGRLRRRWYDAAMRQLEPEAAPEVTA